MTLEDVFADIADLGATGIEILGEGNVPSYPTPDAAWIDTWHGLLEKYGLTATNYGSWVDTTDVARPRPHRRGGRRAAPAGPAAGQAARASPRSGRSSASSPGSSTRTRSGRSAVERSLDLAAELDVVICPEIHAPTPIKHPVTQGYVDFIERTGTEHFKLLIDTGIFNTAPVLELSEEIESVDGGEVPEHLRPLAVPMADLVEVLPHVHFIQAKFAEVDDDLNDLHVPWGEIIPTLQEPAGPAGCPASTRAAASLGRGPRPGPPPARAAALAGGRAMTVSAGALRCRRCGAPIMRPS